MFTQCCARRQAGPGRPGDLTGLAALVWVFNPAFGLALVLPGLVPHFLTGGAADVYGNATGGRRGAAFGSLLNGLLITFLPAILLKALGSFGEANTTFGDADFGWFGAVLGSIGKLDGTVGLIGLLIFGLLILAGAWIMQTKVVDPGWNPGGGVTAAPAEADTVVPAQAAGVATYATITPPRGAPTPPPAP